MLIIFINLLFSTIFINIGKTNVQSAKTSNITNIDISLLVSMLAGLIESGYSIEKAIRTIVKIKNIPYKDQLCLIARGLREGMSLKSLKNLFIKDLSLLFDTLNISLRTGMSPSETLKSTIQTYNKKRLVDAKVKVENIGVNILLPLGLCYLPSFIMLGIIPIVISMFLLV